MSRLKSAKPDQDLIFFYIPDPTNTARIRIHNPAHQAQYQSYYPLPRGVCNLGGGANSRSLLKDNTRFADPDEFYPDPDSNLREKCFHFRQQIKQEMLIS